MRQLLVRNVDDAIVGALRRRAARHGRSAEAEHREILRQSLENDLAESSFKELLSTMPDVGADDELAPPRDLPRDIE